MTPSASRHSTGVVSLKLYLGSSLIKSPAASGFLGQGGGKDRDMGCRVM